MGYNTKNYTEQGGDVTHIGGKLIIEEGASVEGLPSSGGTQLYKHKIVTGEYPSQRTIILISKSDTPITSKGTQFITDCGGEEIIFKSFGSYPVFAFHYKGNNTLDVHYASISDTGELSVTTKTFDTADYTDTVTAL